jgi:hypothetical protein
MCSDVHSFISTYAPWFSLRRKNSRRGVQPTAARLRAASAVELLAVPAARAGSPVCTSQPQNAAVLLQAHCCDQILFIYESGVSGLGET